MKCHRLRLCLLNVLLFGKAKRKASEELGEAQTVWDTLQKDLDSCKLTESHWKFPEYLRLLSVQCHRHLIASLGPGFFPSSKVIFF